MGLFDRFKKKEEPVALITDEDVPSLANLVDEGYIESLPPEKYDFFIDYYGAKYINLEQLTNYIRVEAANFDIQKKQKEKVALYALAKMLEDAAKYDKR